jgi:ABC-2 type transport system ATP-binding protein
VAESVALYENASALENLRFFARLGGVAVSPTGASEALSAAGLDEHDHRRLAGECSKGMRQKIGIAIAMTRGATNLLLDEPTSGLDPRAAAELMASLRHLRDEGRAILMSTHDVARVAEHADRVGIMHGGVLRTEIAAQGATSQSLHDEFARCSEIAAPE